jgi:uncharacterized membrane protein YfcA
MLVQLVVVTLLAAIAQGVAGFGFTLLAVSFFLLALGATDAVQLVILINFAISVVLVARLWRSVPPRLWAMLAGGGLLGFPLGLWAFTRADLELVELAVATVTIAFAAALTAQEMGVFSASVPTSLASPAPSAPDPPSSSGAYSLATTTEAVRSRPLSALTVGIAAGALTSSLGAPGPPVVLYLTRLRLDKTTFRGLALSTFIVMQLGSLLGQWLYVGIDARVWGYAAALVPVAALGAAIGHLLCRHISEDVFRRVVLALLFATGGYMLFRALTG